MKKMKKFVSVLLVMMMALSMSVIALAAKGSSPDTKGSITVTNTVKGTSYSIYRIFDLESFDTESGEGAYSYKVNSSWTDFVNGTEIKNVYVKVDGNGYVTWVENANVVDFMTKAIAYATAENTIEPVATKASSADKEEVKFDNLELGYYLVDSSLGALCALDTTKPDVEVIEKNSNPSLTKEVKEGEAWGDKNDANIGDVVEFRATITVQGVAKDYVMHDVMANSLTYGSVSDVTLNGATVDNTDNKNYEVITSTSDSCTFEVKFTEAFCDSLKTGDKIVVFYSATLNENAIVKNAETNRAHLAYKDSNGDTYETQTGETKTYTWELPVLKYANEDITEVLAGAKFSLYKDEACTENIKFKEVKAEGKTTVYRVATDGEVTEITTDATGRFRIEGLDAGTYYLKETEAPVGYNKLDTVVTVTINHDGQINPVDKDENGAIDAGEYETEIGISNKAGAKLPSTGGIGVTIFYVAGSILVIGAAVLLITKKRMSVEK